VIWIWMENKNVGSIFGNRENAPYENELADKCGAATNYSALMHGSLPNYIAATSGDTWGIDRNKPPAAYPLTAQSIYSQLTAAGKTWREYEESAPGNCPQDGFGLYKVEHDPVTYYTSIAGDCGRWDEPLGTTGGGNLVSDLNGNTLPSFAFITPNLCDDTHNCHIGAGDDWLRTWVPLLTASPAYRAGRTAIFITWDESDPFTYRVALIAISPSTRPGTQASDPFNHYSLLKTTEQMLGLGLLGHAGDPTTATMATPFNLLGKVGNQ
jgi:phosphatidylinositol-3-phosphatase